tara:strand:- start:1055 stop:1240 length:186 start_codon:yes stop_codon:yes gene_type:complete
MLNNAERFFKVYSGLPIEERQNPIVVIDDEPINWKLAHEEVSNETKRGEKILNMLIDLEII